MTALLLLFAAVAAADDMLPIEAETGILRVSSQYEAGIREVGTGILLADPPRRPGEATRYFVLTCAHLTGGQDVEVAGLPLASVAKGERRDALRDVDVIEIDPAKLPARPFARRVEPEKDMAYMKDLFYTSTGRSDEARELSLDELSVDETSLGRWEASGAGKVPMTPEKEPAYALQPGWSDAAKVLSGAAVSVRHNPEDFYRGGHGTDILNGKLLYNPLSKTISAPARIAPGMSCAPLVKKFDKSDHSLVIGLGTEFRVATAQSTFNSSQLLLENMSAYKKGNPPPEFAAQWKSQHGLLYVDLGEAGAEVIPQKPAGNGVAVPSGNGATIPPGNGATIPPGKRGGAGGTLESPPPGPPACDPKKMDDQDPWTQSQIKPGVLWQGKEVLGFSLRFPYESAKPPYPQSQPFLVYPDREGIEFRLRHGSSAAEARDVATGSPILEWLDRRYDEQAMDSHPIDLALPRYRLLAPAGYGLGSDMIERRKDSLRVQLEGPGGDRIEFQLNQWGCLGGGKDFKPIVEVRGKSGDVYVIDLTDLFFMQVANIEPEPVGKDLGQEVLRQGRSLQYNGKKNQRDEWLDMLLSPYCAGCRRQAALTFRKKCSGEEFRPRFSTVVNEEVVSACGADGDGERLEIKGLPEAIDALTALWRKLRGE